MPVDKSNCSPAPIDQHSSDGFAKRKTVNLLLCVTALVTVFFLPSLFDALAVTQTVLSTPLFLSLSIATVLCVILQVVIGALLLLKVA